MNWLDFIGAGLSLSCTYYFTQAKRFAWLIGIAATLLNGALYWQKGLYGAISLEIIYFFTMFVGWFHWSSTKKEKPIRHLSFNELITYIFIAVIGTFSVAFLLKNYANSDVPYWDAITTVLSLIAQWLLCLKVLHCWILWFIVDALIALLQFYKGIPFHSAMHWFYLFMAVMGYYRWKKLYHQQSYPNLVLPNYA